MILGEVPFRQVLEVVLISTETNVIILKQRVHINCRCTADIRCLKDMVVAHFAHSVPIRPPAVIT